MITLTLREYVAALTLAAIISKFPEHSPDYAAKRAVALADGLLLELKKENR